MPRLPAPARCWIWRIAYLKLLLGLLAIPSVPLHVLAPAPTAPPAMHVAQSSDASAFPAAPAQQFHSNRSPRKAAPGGSWTCCGPRCDSRGSRFVAAGRRPIGIAAAGRSAAANADWPGSRLRARCMFAAWVVGVLFGVWRLLVAWKRTIVLRRLGIPADAATARLCRDLCVSIGIHAAPSVKVVPALTTPLLTGMRRAEILIPDTVHDTDGDGLRAILAHELAHLKRRDLQWRWMPIVGRLLFFFHPLVWLAEREWDVATEVAADEVALSTTFESATPIRRRRTAVQRRAMGARSHAGPRQLPGQRAR